MLKFILLFSTLISSSVFATQAAKVNRKLAQTSPAYTMNDQVMSVAATFVLSGDQKNLTATFDGTNIVSSTNPQCQPASPIVLKNDGTGVYSNDFMIARNVGHDVWVVVEKKPSVVQGTLACGANTYLDGSYTL